MSDKKLAILKVSIDSRRPEQLGCQFIAQADFELISVVFMLMS
jgi:hypothetical protein